MDLFVTCGQGFEPLVVEELIELGYPQVFPGFRGVHIKNVDMTAVYHINYLSRLAGRVLLPLLRFRCYDRKSLYQEIAKIHWQQYLPRDATFAIDANVTHRNLRNSLYAAQVAKDAICDQLRLKSGRRPDVDVKDPDIQLNLYINQDSAVMSFDSSGKPLHKRGYRQESGEAPLQETLAAAILRLAKYKGTETVCDPCCGSGTLLIEAAFIASRTPPGFLRKSWGFANFPGYLQEDWLKMKSEADAKRVCLPKQLLFGVDINTNTVRICKTNLKAAGFHLAIDIAHSDFREYEPQSPAGFIISNPPHGRRLDDIKSLRPLYRALGDFMKQRTVKPARGFVFTGSLELAKEVGLAAKRRHVLDNSGIESRLLEFDLY
jgi:putative N6-adenine-specific DNA methylase